MTQEIITITVEAGQMTARRKSRKIDQRRPVPVWASMTLVFYGNIRDQNHTVSDHFGLLFHHYHSIALSMLSHAELIYSIASSILLDAVSD